MQRKVERPMRGCFYVGWSGKASLHLSKNTLKTPIKHGKINPIISKYFDFLVFFVNASHPFSPIKFSAFLLLSGRHKNPSKT